MEAEEKRMAGDYEIIQAVYIGDREIVVGENQNDKNGQKYMTAFCHTNELFSRYDEILVSDDYAETIQYFGKRIEKQAKETREQLFESGHSKPITAEGCKPFDYAHDDLNKKYIVINPEVLRREYRMEIYQLYLCQGGFGANPNSRGSALFCKNLYSGKETRFERQDVLGTIERADLPEWAKDRLAKIEREEVHRHEPER